MQRLKTANMTNMQQIKLSAKQGQHLCTQFLRWQKISPRRNLGSIPHEILRKQGIWSVEPSQERI